MVSLVLFMSFARVIYNQYAARWISKTKSQNTRKWRNGGIISPLFDGLTYNTSGHFAHCSYFPSPLRGSEKYYATRKIYPRVLCVKPSNKVYLFLILLRRLLLSLAFVLLYFIVTCLVLYLIKPTEGFCLINASLNPSSHSGTLSFLRILYSESFNRLELNFQYEVFIMVTSGCVIFSKKKMVNYLHGYIIMSTRFVSDERFDNIF